MRFKVKKTPYFLVAPLCPSFLKCADFTKFIVLRSEACSYWPAIQCIVIGRIPQAWDGDVTHLTMLWSHVPVRRDKNDKKHYKWGICCIQWNIITDYKDLYCIFMRRVNITMSAFVIGKTTSTTLHCSKLVFESSVTETYLQAVSQKHQTLLAKLELLHFIETVFEHSWQATLSQIQEIVLCKMRCTHSNICVVLFWNSVVNIT